MSEKISPAQLAALRRIAANPTTAHCTDATRWRIDGMKPQTLRKLLELRLVSLGGGPSRWTANVHITKKGHEALKNADYSNG